MRCGDQIDEVLATHTDCTHVRAEKIRAIIRACSPTERMMASYRTSSPAGSGSES